MDYTNFTKFAQIPNFSTAAVLAEELMLPPSFYNDSILNSRAVMRSAKLDKIAGFGQMITTIPYINDLDKTIVENVAAIDPSIEAVPNGITGGKQTLLTHFRDAAWGASRIIPTLKGVDPIKEMAQRHARYKMDRRLELVVTMLKAVHIAAPNTMKIVHDDVASLKLLLKIKQLKGEAKGNLKTVFMSSLQHYYIQDAQFGFRSPAETQTQFGTFDGLEIVVSDAMPDTLIAVVGDGAFLYGEANLGANAIEYEANAMASRGWGGDAFVGRWQEILQPRGFDFVGVVDADNASPTNLELKDGADWNLVAGVPAKNVPFAFATVTTTPKVAE